MSVAVCQCGYYSHVLYQVNCVHYNDWQSAYNLNVKEFIYSTPSVVKCTLGACNM